MRCRVPRHRADDLRSTCVTRSLADQFRAFSAVAETVSDLIRQLSVGPGADTVDAAGAARAGLVPSWAVMLASAVLA
jgi:hypothetical protein